MDTADPAPRPASVVRGHRRGSGWSAVTYGVHRRVDGHDDLELEGWQLLLTQGGCFTGLTALALHGVPLPPLPVATPVFLALGVDDPRPMRTGVHTSRHRQPVPFTSVRGLRVATVPEALAAAGRWVGAVDLVAVVDAALHHGVTTVADLEAIALGRRPGSRALRNALGHADGRAQSLWESLLRLLHVSCGIDVEPQWVLHDVDGSTVAEADLWLTDTTSLHEYDGDDHEQAPRRVKDRRRDRRIDRRGFVRRGYTSGDVIHRAVTVLEDADRALGRPHDPARIREWHDLLRDSLFTAQGRAAFLGRIPVPSPRR